MALGGGTFTTQNKILPGTYINFISTATASATLSDRGYATMGLTLDWGTDGEIFTVTNADFQKYSQKLFGYAYAHEKLKPLRDLFLNLSTLYAYRLNSGVNASNSFATALYSGVRGNDLTVVIAANVDDEDLFDVSLYLDTTLLDSQTVADATALTANDYVTWIATATLAETAGTPLTGGTNGTVTSANHQAYLDKAESYSYNIMGTDTTESTIKQLYHNYVKRMRDEVGAKFQLVVHGYAGDYEGTINIKNSVTDTDTDASMLVYWVTGAQAGCAVNASCLNKQYTGEYTIATSYTQAQLENAITSGEFTLHNVGTEVRVLSDINSLVTTSDTKGDIFKENQTMRVCDQIANDIATVFNTKYLGVVPNDAAGRVSLWADIVKLHTDLQDIRAIQDFSENDVTVEQGDTKKAVVVSDVVSVVNAMAQLYMTVEVS